MLSAQVMKVVVERKNKAARVTPTIARVLIPSHLTRFLSLRSSFIRLCSCSERDLESGAAVSPQPLRRRMWDRYAFPWLFLSPFSFVSCIELALSDCSPRVPSFSFLYEEKMIELKRKLGKKQGNLSPIGKSRTITHMWLPLPSPSSLFLHMCLILRRL